MFTKAHTYVLAAVTHTQTLEQPEVSFRDKQRLRVEEKGDNRGKLYVG